MKPTRSLLLLILVILSLVSIIVVNAQSETTQDTTQDNTAQQQPGTVTLEGLLTVLHKDPERGSGEVYQGLVLFYVSREESYVLDMPMGQVWDYIGKRVRVVGRTVNVPAADNLGRDTMIQVDFILPLEEVLDPATNLNPSAGNFKYINVLCQFSDTGAAPNEPAYFDALFSMEYPGIGHHWATASGGKVSLEGTTTMNT